MRPALCAREMCYLDSDGFHPRTPFNEARALCAGNAPGRPAAHRQRLPSMRPALCAREMVRNILSRLGTPCNPSMRPALCAREMRMGRTMRPMRTACPFNEARALCAGNVLVQGVLRKEETSFNEARALCAGNVPVKRLPTVLLIAFNEARALCAGNERVHERPENNQRPSMRPALCAREMAVHRMPD